MGLLAKRALVWAAVYGIALQSILAPTALPAASTANVDPYTVICHADAQTADIPGSQPGAPAPACDHCVLCGVTLAGATPDPVSSIAPRLTRSARLPGPAVTLSPVSSVAQSNLPRGPPPAA